MGQYIPFDQSELSLLNNFFCHFPIGNDPYKNPRPQGMYRTASAKNWNRTTREFLAEQPAEEVQRDYFGKSDKYLDQSVAEFYAEVDRTVEELGISMFVISKKINKYLYTQRGEEGEERGKRVDELLGPIYAALRNKGYNRPELYG